jgi:SHS2 domain-containing protein
MPWCSRWRRAECSSESSKWNSGGAGQLRATAWGEPVEVTRHQPAVEVKGATYTELRVQRTEDGGWLAQCVVDV